MLRITKVFKKIVAAVKAGKRIIINRGGTSSSKTFSLLQFLFIYAMKHPNTKIDIVSNSIPALKKGVINDITSGGIAAQVGIKNFYDIYNKSDRVIDFGNGSTINFIAFQNELQARGPRRNILYVNEANRIPWEIFEQMFIRTSGLVFVDFNPSQEFWVKDQLLENPKYADEVCEIVSTYLDNDFLPETNRQAIEAKKDNEHWWRIYGLGEWGVYEGLVFDNVVIKEFNPDGFSKYRYGIDWGFSQDPFVCGEMAIEGNDLYICREIYGRGLLNADVAADVKDMVGTNIVTADSAEPKSIQDFVSRGITCVAARKGKGSIESGIKMLQAFDHIYIHPSCVGAITDFKNYVWKKDKMTGKSLAIPESGFDHWPDAARYALEHDMVDWVGNAPKKTAAQIHQEKLDHQADVLNMLLKKSDDMLYTDLEDI